MHGYEQVSPLTPDGSEAYSIHAKHAKLGLGDEEEGSFRSACGPFWPPKAMESLEPQAELRESFRALSGGSSGCLEGRAQQLSLVSVSLFTQRLSTTLGTLVLLVRRPQTIG